MDPIYEKAWRNKLYKEFEEQYGELPTASIELWRIWKAEWAPKRPHWRITPLSPNSRIRLAKKMAIRRKQEEDELAAYKANPPVAQYVPKERDRTQTYMQRWAGYRAKQRFYSYYGCWPYQAPEKVLVWCEILNEEVGDKPRHVKRWKPGDPPMINIEKQGNRYRAHLKRESGTKGYLGSFGTYKEALDACERLIQQLSQQSQS